MSNTSQARRAAAARGGADARGNTPMQAIAIVHGEMARILRVNARVSGMHARTLNTDVTGSSVSDIVTEVVVLLAIRTVRVNKRAPNSEPARFMLGNAAAYTR